LILSNAGHRTRLSTTRERIAAVIVERKAAGIHESIAAGIETARLDRISATVHEAIAARIQTFTAAGIHVLVAGIVVTSSTAGGCLATSFGICLFHVAKGSVVRTSIGVDEIMRSCGVPGRKDDDFVAHAQIGIRQCTASF